MGLRFLSVLLLITVPALCQETGEDVCKDNAIAECQKQYSDTGSEMDGDPWSAVTAAVRLCNNVPRATYLASLECFRTEISGCRNRGAVRVSNPGAWFDTVCNSINMNHLSCLQNQIWTFACGADNAIEAAHIGQETIGDELCGQHLNATSCNVDLVSRCGDDIGELFQRNQEHAILQQCH